MVRSPFVPPHLYGLYEIEDWRNGLAIMNSVHPESWREITTVLSSFRLKRSQIVEPGRNKSPIAKHLDDELRRFDWKEKRFDVSWVIDDEEHNVLTHGIDCYKDRVALEVEWNNKDPFFDRDLLNFSHLFQLGAIDVGVILTRSSRLQEIFDELGKGKSYGNSTTHMSKLIPRVEAGGGGGCPLIAFGIRKEAYEDDLGT